MIWSHCVATQRIFSLPNDNVTRIHTSHCEMVLVYGVSFVPVELILPFILENLIYILNIFCAPLSDSLNGFYTLSKWVLYRYTHFIKHILTLYF